MQQQEVCRMTWTHKYSQSDIMSLMNATDILKADVNEILRNVY